MAAEKIHPLYAQLKFYHILVWLLFLLFSFKYHTVSTPGIMAWAMAFITTIFAILTFYISYYMITPVTGKNKVMVFIMVSIVFVAGISFFETVLELAVYRVLPGNSKHWYFMSRLWSSAFFTGFVLLAGIALRLTRNSYREQERLDGIIKEKLSAELAYLKNQIHPHFLFNIHNTIYFLINENPALAARMVLKLSEVMRYQLYDCQAEYVDLEKELHNISNYIDLEKTRLGNKVTVHYDVPGVADAQIAPFMLIPFIENAFKHISHFTDRMNLINIIARLKNDYFYFTVTNTCEKNQKEPGTEMISKGIGLQNLQRRLHLIYGDKFEMNFGERDHVFTAYLKLQLV